jgi:hypothetical protein
LFDPIASFPLGEDGQGGERVVGGQFYGGTITSLLGQFVFATSAGSIYTISEQRFRPGETIPTPAIENRTADFRPDVGALQPPILLEGALGHLLIATRGGEIFRVEPE